jgi:hypothetical protein
LIDGLHRPHYFMTIDLKRLEELEELAAERNFFWTIAYLDVSKDYAILPISWKDCLYLGDLNFYNFWEIFDNFKLNIDPNIPEEKIELFIAHQIWKHKIENDTFVDVEIKRYLIGQRHHQWLSSQLN